MLITLGAVFLTWWLTGRSERRRRALDLLEKRFEAFRQLRTVVDNIPRGATVDGLTARLKKEPELLNSLNHRLGRIFGLRIELVPYLDEDVASYIDEDFGCLFQAETGTLELKPGMEDRFARCCVELVAKIDRLETQLIEVHRKISK